MILLIPRYMSKADQMVLDRKVPISLHWLYKDLRVTGSGGWGLCWTHLNSYEMNPVPGDFLTD